MVQGYYFPSLVNHDILPIVISPGEEVLRSYPIFREFPNRRRTFFIAGRLSRADIGLWFESLYSAVRADRRGAACSMAGGVMDDRSRTVFHTINNRYRRPVVNPELSSRGAGRRGTRGRVLLSRDQEAIGGPPRASLHAFEYLEYLASARTPRSRLPDSRVFERGKGPIEKFRVVEPARFQPRVRAEGSPARLFSFKYLIKKSGRRTVAVSFGK